MPPAECALDVHVLRSTSLTDGERSAHSSAGPREAEAQPYLRRAGPSATGTSRAPVDGTNFSDSSL
jgi:hypothetical protein